MGDVGAWLFAFMLSGGLFLLLWLLSAVALAVACLASRRRMLRDVVRAEVDQAIGEHLAELVPGQRDGGHDAGPVVVLPVQRREQD